MKRFVALLLAYVIALGSFTASAQVPIYTRSSNYNPAAVAITGGNTWFVPSGGASGALVACPADTTEDILATITIPPLSANAMARVWMVWETTNNANVKTYRVRLGGIAGFVFGSGNVASNITTATVAWLQNQNATNSQVGGVTDISASIGSRGTAISTGAIDTSVSTTIVITAMKATAGDTMNLRSYLVEIYKP
jgi:hypothetical protein